MPEKPNAISFGRMVAAIAVMTMIVSGSMAFVYYEGMRMAAVHTPQADAAMEIKLEATRAHLWFEEIISGDTHESIDAVWNHLDTSLWYAHAMLEGGSNDEVTYMPVEDKQLREDVAAVLVELAKFRQIAEQRLKLPGTSGAGSAIDQRFDRVFHELMDKADHAETGLHITIRDELAHFRRDQIALIVLSLLLGVIVAVMFGRFIRRINADVKTLHDAHQELERSNRDLASFAYIASHDLREPLRKIQAFGDRLVSKESEHMSDRGKDYIIRMQKAAARMKDLIEALLNYSRIGTKGEAFASTDLNAVMQDVLDDLEFRINETGGTVNVADLPKLDADKTQIRQVFQNLIANALKFQRPDVTPVIQVGHHTKDGMCIFTFSDNGIGFEPEYAERIFGVFQRLHGRDAYEGTGIGLSICKKTAERHGGDIVANGSPGEGATFTLTLPMAQQGET